MITRWRHIPSGWHVRRLDDVAERGSGHTPSRGVPSYWAGGIKWVSLADSHKLDRRYIRETSHQISQDGIDHSSAELHPAGTVLMSRDAGVGKSAVILEPMAVSQHFITWRCRDELLPLFLYYTLQNEKPFFERIAVGSTIKTIGLGIFRRLLIHLPSVPEQQEITRILNAGDEALEKLDALVAAKECFKTALMQQLLTGRKRLKRFLGKWTDAPLGSVVASNARIVPKPSEAFLAAGIRSHGKGVFLKRQFKPEDIALEELFQIRANDLVVNITFAWEGAVAIVPPEADGALVSHRFPTYECIPGKTVVAFLRHVIRSRRFVFACGLASPGGAGRNRVLGKDAFLGIPIQLPPLPEQEAIAAVLDASDEELRLLRAQRAAVEQQKRGLMQRLLTGKVRVHC